MHSTGNAQCACIVSHFHPGNILDDLKKDERFLRSWEGVMSEAYDPSRFDDAYTEIIQRGYHRAEKLHHIETEPEYTLIRFGMVDWHRDDWETDWYTLYVLQTDCQPELHMRKHNTQVLKLEPGVVYLFNSNLYHKAVAPYGSNTYGLLGGVDAEYARKVVRTLGG